MQTSFQITHERPLVSFSPVFSKGNYLFFGICPGATQQSTVGLPSRSVLFASFIVSFAGRCVLFAGLLWYLLGGMFRVGMEGADLGGPEIAVLAQAPCKTIRSILIGLEPKSLMTDFPWNQLWQLAHGREGSSVSGPEVLKLLSKSAPDIDRLEIASWLGRLNPRKSSGV